MTSPLVSIIVATRNRPEYLARCLDAISEQTYPHFQVVVSDDGSSSAVREAYMGMNPRLNSRITWLIPSCIEGPMTGPSAVRNRGIRASLGTFVAFCDDDDRWACPDHLECAVRAMEATGADFFFTDILSIRGGRPVDDDDWFPDRARLRTGRRIAQAPDVFAVDLELVLAVTARRVIHPNSWVVRKPLLEESGAFWERLWGGEDYNLMMRLLDRASQILFRPDACVEYRLAESDSQFLRSSPTEALLKEIFAAKHAQATCQRELVRKHARAREAWGLRRLGRQAHASGDPVKARAFFRQALGTYPTLGTVWEYLRAL